MGATMVEIELAAGPVEYTDTGAGPVMVFLHGLLMDGTLWRHVVADLAADHRCVTPTLPLGAHRRPVRPGADLSGRGLARLVAEFLDRLDLRDVTLVGCDWGGAQLVVAEGLDGRVGRLVLASQEAFDNYPPGLPGHAIWLASKVPGGLAAAVKPLRWRALRRMPMAFGRLSKRPVPHEVMDAWLRPAITSRAIRRDLRGYLRATRSGEYSDVASRLSTFDRPVLVVWAAEDRVMPPEHGHRLATSFPDARLVEIADSYTLIPEDQPAAFAAAVREFLTRQPLQPMRRTSSRSQDDQAGPP
jgi:pimeloyl-ACP methyl ester carboxylesterase